LVADVVNSGGEDFWILWLLLSQEQRDFHVLALVVVFLVEVTILLIVEIFHSFYVLA
jgi:hypothetical protein